MLLICNVAYKFTCSCDTNVTYIGMTAQHLGVRVEEHLHSKKDSAVQKHVNVYQSHKGNRATSREQPTRSTFEIQTFLHGNCAVPPPLKQTNV